MSALLSRLDGLWQAKGHPPRNNVSMAATFAIISVCALLVVGALFLLSDSTLRLASLALIYGGAAIALNLCAGYAGLLSFAHAAFMGVGGYTYAILTVTYGWNTWLALLAGTLLAALAGAIVMGASVRVKGAYFALITLAFGEIVMAVAQNTRGLTGGSSGLTGAPAISFLGEDLWSPTSVFILSAVMVALIVIVVRALLASNWGDAVCAVGQDEQAAASAGISTATIKIQVFTLSTAIAGLAGAVLVASLGLAAPTSFDLSHSIMLVLMIVVGGLGSILGSLLGAFIIVAIENELQRFIEWRPFVFGTVLIVMLLVRPSGVFGSYSLWLTSKAKKVIRW